MQNNQPKHPRIKQALEVLAIVGPIICLVDCLVIPAAMLLLPLVGIHSIYHGIGDQFIVFLVLIICAPNIIIGFLKHQKKHVLALTAIGFVLIFFANFAGHTIDNTIHIAITIAGSLLLITANRVNRQLNNCNCHSEPVAVIVSTND